MSSIFRTRKDPRSFFDQGSLFYFRFNIASNALYEFSWNLFKKILESKKVKKNFYEQIPNQIPSIFRTKKDPRSFFRSRISFLFPWKILLQHCEHCTSCNCSSNNAGRSVHNHGESEQKRSSIIFRSRISFYFRGNCYFNIASIVPAATAVPITPATFGPIACIKR